MLSLMKRWGFVLLIVMAAAIQLINAQAADNFISIDCGYADSGNGGYIDSETNLKFTSDDAYVDTGNNHQISTSYEIPSLPKQSLTVRSFPTGSRNCYRLPSNKSGKYLLRAAFMYGDYDVGMPMPTPTPMPMENNQNSLMFDLYLGINVWASVSIEDPSVNYIFEAITVAQTDIISVCLINMNHGTPFISSLEMRPFDSSFYPGVSPDQTLALSFRYNTGPTDNKTIRYPDDSYDRIWRPYNNYSTEAFRERTAPGPVNYRSSDLFHVPSSVLLTAVEPIAPFGNISLSWFPDKSVDNPMYYLMLHFCNLYKNTSVIDVSVKGGEMSSNSIVVEYLVAESVYSTSMISDMDSYYFNLSPSTESAYVPLLNAVEVYYTVSISQAFTNPNDDTAMNRIKETYNITRSSWQGDPCAPTGYVWDDVRCTTMNNTPRITYIDLSSGNLVGAISEDFLSLTKLMFLDLSNNSLEGPIPDFLGSLTSLNVLNLSGNCFSGSIPNNLLTNNGLTLRYEGYNNACKNNIAPSKPSNWKDLAIIILACSFGATLAAGILVFFIQRKANKGQDAIIQNRSNNHAQDIPLWPALIGKSTPEMTKYEDEIQLPEICKFTFKELEKITDNFIRFIGRGGFGPVYHGYLEDKKEVAVKIHAHLSTHGMKEFLAEVGFLAKVHHRNLVELVGYCREENHLGLVYEYMSQGCFNDHLRPIGQHSVQKALKWRERLQIALDAAQGLDYLHTGSDAPIIHRDVKSSNILLDQNFRAKIADFGLSKAFENNGQTHMSTKPAGTLGYIDIEYYSTGRLTEKSDVYSFGIVLLELITGDPPMDPRKGHIKKWVLEMVVQGDIDNIADNRLQGDYEINSIWKVVDIAIHCTADSSERRPTMNEVVIQLKESLALEITRVAETYSNSACSINASGPGSEIFEPTLR